MSVRLGKWFVVESHGRELQLDSTIFKNLVESLEQLVTSNTFESSLDPFLLRVEVSTVESHLAFLEVIKDICFEVVAFGPLKKPEEHLSVFSSPTPPLILQKQRKKNHLNLS